MTDTVPKNKFIVPTRWLMAGAAIYDFVALWVMLGWVSTGGIILGRYSVGLAMAMGLVALVGLFWIVSAVFFWQRFEAILQAIPQKYRLAFLAIIGLFFLWWLQQSFRIELVAILATNLLLFAALLILTLSDKPFPMKGLRWLLLALIVFIFFTTFISVMLDRPFNPDESIWGNIAVSGFAHDGLYIHIGFSEPYRILPGLGWITGIYSLLLGTFGYDLQIGRMMQFVIYTMTVGAIGLWGTRLYNYRVGLVAMLIAFLGRVYYPISDYRPDHFVPLGQMLAFSAMISARKSQNIRIQLVLHFLTGLLITLSMQFHASALVFVIALSLFYAGDFICYVWRERKLSADCLRPILSFGLGALIGTMIYYIFNILAVGGLETFLTVLTNERGFSQRTWPTVYSWHELEFFMMFVGVAYLVWRRSNEDKFYLVLLLCWLIGLSVDTQGYSVPYRGLFVVPMALVFVEGFKSLEGRPEWHLRQVAMIAIVIMALLGQRFNFTNWGLIQRTIDEGHLPQHNSVAFAYGVIEHLQDEDWNRVLVGTHELIWALEGHHNFYSPLAEGHAKTQRGWEGTQVWDFLQPDLYIEAATRLATPPGLRAYLEREGFQICEQFNSVSYPVSIYRRECSTD
jgi:hypothetical protein